MNGKIKLFNAALACGLVFSMLLCLAGFDNNCQSLRDNVFRLHIIANSDSPRDQEIKLAVRDALLRESETFFLGDSSLEDAVLSAECNKDAIKAVAEDVLRQYGAEYSLEVSVEDSFFDTRVYDEYTLPAGTYRSLLIKLGKAEGKNWWCVLFPSICVGACASLSETAGEGGAEIAGNAQRYVVRFKIVEIYERIKTKIFELL